ncbi:MAG TPA: hypothetical protein DCZ92_07240 [Elusimicrobia bacterium]|nr:MAG: hypothetical protein A2016_02765 [Elusimicrobia bacterium GWF2_62_30]HBA60600.1 hypothetical protein [Elusimicrobiota bacterium]
MKSLFIAILAVLAAGPVKAEVSGAFSSLQLAAGNYSPAAVSIPVPSPAKFVSYPKAKNEIGARLFAASGRFLGIPYVLGPLGEGASGEFDRSPLVSYSGLDCTTFVEQTMAFALGADEPSALDTLRRIRYRNGVIAYESRNHFPETDWLPNNIAAGFLKDITSDVAGRQVSYVTKVISKRAWYAAKTGADLKGFDSETPQERGARLERLRALGTNIPDQEVKIKYIALPWLKALLANIPSGTVVSLVREARADKPTVITHQFFIFDGPKGKIVRHASQGAKVLDIPADAYIAVLSSITTWKVLGFNLAAVAQ